MKAKTVGKRRIASKANRTAGKRKTTAIAKTGLTSRIYGHISARARRAQGRRDARQTAAAAAKK